MATPSSLISMIQSVLHSHISYKYPSPTELKLRIGLRNIKVHLVCVRNLDHDDKHAMNNLFSRIERAIESFSTDASRYDAAFYGSEPFDDLRAVNRLAEEVNDECAWCTNAIPDHLTLDDVVEVVDSLLLNTADFWKVVEIQSNKASTPNNLRDVMDEFEVRARFLRDFLLFTDRTGEEIHQIQDLLIHIRPFLRGVACAFQNKLPFTKKGWVEEVQSGFPRDSLQVFQFCTQTLRTMLSFDQIDDIVLKDFLSSLISLLWHLLRYQRHHPRHSTSLKALYECLRLSRSILKHKQQNNNSSYLGVLVQDAGILICSLYLTDIDPLILSDLLQRFEVVKALVPLESNFLGANALDFGDSTGIEDLFDEKLQIDTVSASHESSSTPRHTSFQYDEVTSFLDRLLMGSRQLRLLPISGMAGLGKTTFALKVYNHPTVMHHFQARAWCAISQVLDKKRVLLQLLNQTQLGNYSRMTEDDLANKLRLSLKAKRYLIVLDDVWNPKVWESLSPSFPDDVTKSRIVLTSRLRAIVPHARPDEQPYFLRLRSDNECLEIIEMRLWHAVGLRTELGKFAKLCKGLPLTAVLVAGLLSTTVSKGWEGILDHLSLGGISGMEQCKIVLELSYNHLPDDLKLCFIYLGAFPEDEEICAQNLIRLWMAEGFVARKKELLGERVQDIAQEYLDNLIQRNLVMVAKVRSTGGIKTCRVHDLLHDFCMMKGKQENIFHLLVEGRDELSDFNEPCNQESRLVIHSSALHFKDSRLFCPLARSMLLFTPTSGTEECCLPDIVFIIQIYKHLRVLCADQMWCETPIPSEIAFPTRLTYLSISYCKAVIPSSIGNLSNLETLVIKLIETGVASLPHTIWNLRKLQYLSIITLLDEMYCPGFRLPIEDLENSPNLLELESICGVEFYSDGSMENQMRKFPNISSLKCNILRHWESMSKTIVVPEFLSKLKFLTLCSEAELRYQFYFGFAENIRKLTLKGFVLSREEIAEIGKLPNLEVLKLLGIVFFGGVMEMEEGEFSKLRILVFGKYERRGNLERWIAAGDEPLPCLEKLAFRGCSKLMEIPCLETSSTLEEIEVSSSSFALESLVRNIQEVQMDYGLMIKVQIQHEEGRGGE